MKRYTGSFSVNCCLCAKTSTLCDHGHRHNNCIQSVICVIVMERTHSGLSLLDMFLLFLLAVLNPKLSSLSDQCVNRGFQWVNPLWVDAYCQGWDLRLSSTFPPRSGTFSLIQSLSYRVSCVTISVFHQWEVSRPGYCYVLGAQQKAVAVLK